jgi:hypothetical protein
MQVGGGPVKNPDGGDTEGGGDAVVPGPDLARSEG